MNKNIENPPSQYWKQIPALLAVWICAVLFVGCQSQGIFDPPGTMDAQRTRAMRHDPFPSDEIGPPIFGGRPLGFEQPRNEASQLKMAPRSQNSEIVAPPPILQPPPSMYQPPGMYQPPAATPPAMYRPPIYQPPGTYQPAGF